ncbi:SDR family oxidoreductase [Altericroceibacterium spongiae]|uniref:SDR family oxidoreductase n=2 Tax=Altericroceibacterium spongiae TaxID=2320269 RepID=A0A420EQW7_9SPHN|nr:SDR family oxidoreductase [Altericroceibacterium spongiae]
MLGTDAFGKLSPIRKVPILVVDGTPVAESLPICELIEELHPEPALLPGDPLLRARARMLANFANQYIAVPSVKMFGNRRAGGGEDIDKDMRELLTRGLTALETAIATGPYAIGDTSGIGLAVAKGAIAEGAEAFVGSSQAAKVDQAKDEAGEGLSGALIDVTDESSVKAFFEKAGKFDHLVYTAGDWGNRSPKVLTDYEPGDFTDLLKVRFSGAVIVIKHAIPLMNEGGSVTLTGGMVAHRPRKGAPLTTVMAGTIESLVQGLAMDIAPLRTNAVFPGAIDTGVWGAKAAEEFKGFTDPLPISRLGQPEEVAEAYLYLMKGSYTTGTVLMVDGGKVLV